MTLSEAQRIFSVNLARLILWLNDNGIECTIGEVLRTTEQQAIYLKTGKSKTANSAHLKKLAADLNLFVNGSYVADGKSEPYKKMAEHWKTLHPSNVAGFDWGFDGNHVEMKY